MGATFQGFYCLKFLFRVHTSYPNINKSLCRFVFYYGCSCTSFAGNLTLIPAGNIVESSHFSLLRL